jgi:hypothetical protein
MSTRIYCSTAGCNNQAPSGGGRCRACVRAADAAYLAALPDIDAPLTDDELDEIPAGCEATGDRCWACRRAEFYGVHDVYRDDRTGAIRDFQLWTCCEASHDEACAFMREGDRRAVVRFLERVGLPFAIRQVYDDQSLGGLRLDHGLRIGPVTFAQAKAFVAEHHRHNKAPAGWRYGFGAFNHTELVAVVIVGRPVARAIDPATTVEVTRLCVDPSIDRALSWNACSLLYAEAAREAKRRGFARIVTYTLVTELGTTLKAAGWQAVATTKGGSWNCPSRPRIDTAPTCRKTRWHRELAPSTTVKEIAA